jgi:hypothetical protein
MNGCQEYKGLHLCILLCRSISPISRPVIPIQTPILNRLTDVG